MFAVSPVIYGITRISSSIMVPIIQYRYITKKIAVFSHQQNRFWNIKNTEHVCTATLDPIARELDRRLAIRIINQISYIFLLNFFFNDAFYRGAKIANFKKRGRKKMDRFFYLIKQSFFFLSDIL